MLFLLLSCFWYLGLHLSCALFDNVQVIRDAPDVQQQQQQPGDDAADDADGPQYAELAPSTRRTERSHIVVDKSTAVYAIIIHPRRD